jgi:hypothetical protein
MASKTFKIVPSNPFFRKDNKEMPLLQSSLTSACHVQGSLNSPSVLKGNYNFSRAVEKNKKKTRRYTRTNLSFGRLFP